MTNETPAAKPAASSNPFLLKAESEATATALLESDGTGTEYDKPTVETFEPKTNSLAELAATDTSHISAIRNRAESIIIRTEKYIVKESKDVRALCDAIDAELQGEDSLSGLSLASVRNYVQHLMVTLKMKPEFSTILLDSDVKNIVVFAREVYHNATLEAEMMEAKKTSRAIRKPSAARTQSAKKVNAKADAMSAAFDALGDF